MRVLVIAPHPDDEAIGCGGTIVRHVEAGDRVDVVFLTSGELSHKERPAGEVKLMREREAEAAAEVLGVDRAAFLRLPDWGLESDLEGATAALTPLLERAEPDRVYAPHAHEWHRDHAAAFAITSLATRALSATVLAYEVWTPLREYTVVEDITEQIARKLDAIRCYASQLSEFDYVQAASGLNRYRGALAGRTAYAEVFHQARGGDLR